MMFQYLFSPLKLGTVEVKNRISFQPHLTNLAVGNLPSERQMYYWGERAKGGAGLIITEEMSVHPTDMASTSCSTPGRSASCNPTCATPAA
jgi:2,4-dienoyl-CoA reductase-like NADH-dependent reductase (Old Yellow Enzyme family)